MKLFISISLVTLSVLGFVYFKITKPSPLETSETSIIFQIDTRGFRVGNYDTRDKEINLLRHRDTIIKAITDFQLDSLYEKNTFSLRDEIATNLEIKKASQADQLQVIIHAESTEKAQQIAYSLMRTFQKISNDRRNQLSAHTIANIKRQIIEQEKSIKEIKAKYDQLRYSPANVSSPLGLAYPEGYTPPKQKPQPPFYTFKKIQIDNARKEYIRESDMLELLRGILENKEWDQQNISQDLSFDSLGWTPEVEKFMEVRRKK